MPKSAGLTVEGETIPVSNLEKALYLSGFTKAQVIDYYIRVSRFLLPHLKDGPVTLKRYPDGVPRGRSSKRNRNNDRRDAEDAEKTVILRVSAPLR